MATVTLRPNGDGDLLECSIYPASPTTHYDKVDEETADDNTTYISHPCVTLGSLYDLYQIPDVGELGSISQITIYTRVKTTRVSIYTALKTGGVVHSNTDGQEQPADWADTHYHWATNPETGLAWTWANIASLQIGARIEYQYTGTPKYGQCTQIWVVIDYSIGATITTQAVTGIVGTVAVGNGNITSLGDPNPTQHGHCWNTGGAPTTADSKTENGAASATGAFTSAITGLVAGTLYYVRAYATNSAGTSYGNQVNFTADKGTVFPTEAITRVTSLVHRYSRGVYTLEINLGELVADFPMPETPRRGTILPTALLPIPVVKSTTAITPVAPIETSDRTKAIMETEAYKAAESRRRGIELGVNVVPPYAIDVLRKNEQAAKLLLEIQKLNTATSATGITNYARGVLLKRIVELKAQLDAIYRSR